MSQACSVKVKVFSQIAFRRRPEDLGPAQGWGAGPRQGGWSQAVWDTTGEEGKVKASVFPCPRVTQTEGGQGTESHTGSKSCAQTLQCPAQPAVHQSRLCDPEPMVLFSGLQYKGRTPWWGLSAPPASHSPSLFFVWLLLNYSFIYLNDLQLEIKTGALCMLGNRSTTQLHPQPPFSQVHLNN